MAALSVEVPGALNLKLEDLTSDFTSDLPSNCAQMTDFEGTDTSRLGDDTSALPHRTRGSEGTILPGSSTSSTASSAVTSGFLPQVNNDLESDPDTPLQATVKETMCVEKAVLNEPYEAKPLDDWVSYGKQPMKQDSSTVHSVATGKGRPKMASPAMDVPIGPPENVEMHKAPCTNTLDQVLCSWRLSCACSSTDSFSAVTSAAENRSNAPSINVGDSPAHRGASNNANQESYDALLADFKAVKRGHWHEARLEFLRDFDFMSRLPAGPVLDYAQLGDALPPPINPDFPSLFVDLDETLSHTDVVPANDPMTEHIIKLVQNHNAEGNDVETEAFLSGGGRLPDLVFASSDSQDSVAFVYFRPWITEFLRMMAQQYELICFTASLKTYADTILDALDPEKLISHRLYRDACTQYGSTDIYFKDLNGTGRDLLRSVLLDNRVISFGLNVDNGILVTNYYGSPQDMDLLSLIPFLTTLSREPDVRAAIRKVYQLSTSLEQYRLSNWRKELDLLIEQEADAFEIMQARWRRRHQVMPSEEAPTWDGADASIYSSGKQPRERRKRRSEKASLLEKTTNDIVRGQQDETSALSEKNRRLSKQSVKRATKRNESEPIVAVPLGGDTMPDCTIDKDWRATTGDMASSKLLSSRRGSRSRNSRRADDDTMNRGGFTVVNERGNIDQLDSSRRRSKLPHKVGRARDRADMTEEESADSYNGHSSCSAAERSNTTLQTLVDRKARTFYDVGASKPNIATVSDVSSAKTSTSVKTMPLLVSSEKHSRKSATVRAKTSKNRIKHAAEVEAKSNANIFPNRANTAIATAPSVTAAPSQKDLATGNNHKSTFGSASRGGKDNSLRNPTKIKTPDSLVNNPRPQPWDAAATGTGTRHSQHTRGHRFETPTMVKSATDNDSPPKIAPEGTKRQSTPVKNTTAVETQKRHQTVDTVGTTQFNSGSAKAKIAVTRTAAKETANSDIAAETVSQKNVAVQQEQITESPGCHGNKNPSFSGCNQKNIFTNMKTDCLSDIYYDPAAASGAHLLHAVPGDKTVPLQRGTQRQGGNIELAQPNTTLQHRGIVQLTDAPMADSSFENYHLHHVAPTHHYPRTIPAYGQVSYTMSHQNNPLKNCYQTSKQYISGPPVITSPPSMVPASSPQSNRLSPILRASPPYDVVYTAAEQAYAVSSLERTGRQVSPNVVYLSGSSNHIAPCSFTRNNPIIYGSTIRHASGSSVHISPRLGPAHSSAGPAIRHYSNGSPRILLHQNNAPPTTTQTPVGFVDTSQTNWHTGPEYSTATARQSTRLQGDYSYAAPNSAYNPGGAGLVRQRVNFNRPVGMTAVSPLAVSYEQPTTNYRTSSPRQWSPRRQYITMEPANSWNNVAAQHFSVTPSPQRFRIIT